MHFGREGRKMNSKGSKSISISQTTHRNPLLPARQAAVTNRKKRMAVWGTSLHMLRISKQSKNKSSCSKEENKNPLNKLARDAEPLERDSTHWQRQKNYRSHKDHAKNKQAKQKYDPACTQPLMPVRGKLCCCRARARVKL